MSENSDTAEPPAASLVTKEEEESPMIDITEEVAKAQEVAWLVNSYPAMFSNIKFKVVRNSFPFSITTELYERLTRL